MLVSFEKSVQITPVYSTRCSQAFYVMQTRAALLRIACRGKAIILRSLEQ